MIVRIIELNPATIVVSLFIFYIYSVCWFVYISCVNAKLVPKAEAVNMYYVEKDIPCGHLYRGNTFYFICMKI